MNKRFTSTNEMVDYENINMENCWKLRECVRRGNSDNMTDDNEFNPMIIKPNEKKPIELMQKKQKKKIRNEKTRKFLANFEAAIQNLRHTLQNCLTVTRPLSKSRCS